VLDERSLTIVGFAPRSASAGARLPIASLCPDERPELREHKDKSPAGHRV
jgi:hypothetical protein